MSLRDSQALCALFNGQGGEYDDTGWELAGQLCLRA